MKKIIVFTKKSSLNTGFDDIADEREDLGMLDGKKAIVILLDEATSEFKLANNFSQDGLYLVYDLIAESVFNSLIGKLDKSEIFVLKHGEPSFSLEGFACKNTGVTEKRETGGRHYPDLIEIICDDNPLKVKRVFKSIFAFDTTDVDSFEDTFDSLYGKKGVTKKEDGNNTKQN